ncbi:MAG: dihydrofolate reductase [Pirellulaceae bacterium]
MPLSLIVAMSENRVIGRDGDLPWRLSSDLRRFKSLTMGHHLLMGRKTFDSIGRCLPGRTTVVLSRDADFQAPGILVASDLTAALEFAKHDPEPFVVGGAQIYELALPQVDRLYITRVKAQVAGDTFFPPLDESRWQLASTQSHPASDRDEYPHAFEVWQRIV